MIAIMNEAKPKLHPQKYLLWLGLVGIVMMFAGLSSAYIVKSSQANWLSFRLPLIFWYSSAIMLLSSLTMILCRKAFINREMNKYKNYLTATTLLGVAFVLMQYIGFTELWSTGITLTRNVSFSFLYVIVGLHALHVVAGVLALIIIYIRSFRVRKKVYTSVSVDLMNTYWHFVDILWIYLFIFLMMIG